MKKLLSVLLVIGLVSVMMLAGCSNGGSSKGNSSSQGSGSSKDNSSSSGKSGDKKIKIIAAHNQTDTKNPYQKGLLKFKNVAEKESNGNIQVEVHAGTLGTQESELVQKLKTGGADVVVVSPGFMTGTGIKQVDLFALYYMFNSYDHWSKVVDGKVGKHMGEIMNKKSNNTFKLLGYYSAGVRDYYGKKPLHSVKDLKGMKIRTQTSGAIADFWKAAGAVPTDVDWGELYQALQQGVVDGAENSYPYFVQQNHEKTKNGKYVTETDHTYTTRFLLINGKKFDSYTDKQQKIIRDAAKASVKTERKSLHKQEEKYKQIAIKNGAKINKVNLKPFKKIAKPIQDKYAKKIGMEKELKEIREMGKTSNK